MKLFRVVEGPFRASWTRVMIEMMDFNVSRLQRWILLNTNGRFGIISVYPKTAIFFEDDHDAILFRLKDGVNAWKDDDN